MASSINEGRSTDRTTAAIFEAFHVKSSVQKNFSAQYYMLGAMEESTEVLEAVRDFKSKGAGATADDAIAVVKEVGDVLWYCTGLCRANGIELASIVGEDFVRADAIASSSTEAEHEVALVLQIGHLAGRLKKYERGDYDTTQLQQYFDTLLPGVFGSLAGVCRTHGGVALADAAAANITKINKRLAQNTIHGDGSNREGTHVAQKRSAESLE
jgi:NTP pyrophosphatase (non-canonical NTP hydrolase)